jgi:hypothetical protein
MIVTDYFCVVWSSGTIAAVISTVVVIIVWDRSVLASGIFIATIVGTFIVVIAAYIRVLTSFLTIAPIISTSIIIIALYRSRFKSRGRFTGDCYTSIM